MIMRGLAVVGSYVWALTANWGFDKRYPATLYSPKGGYPLSTNAHTPAQRKTIKCVWMKIGYDITSIAASITSCCRGSNPIHMGSLTNRSATLFVITMSPTARLYRLPAGEL